MQETRMMVSVKRILKEREVGLEVLHCGLVRVPYWMRDPSKSSQNLTRRVVWSSS